MQSSSPDKNKPNQHIVYRAKVSPQGQITLPKDLRQHMGLPKGSSYVYLHLDSGDLVASSSPAIGKYYGALAPQSGQASVADSIMDIRAEQRARFIDRAD